MIPILVYFYGIAPDSVFPGPGVMTFLLVYVRHGGRVAGAFTIARLSRRRDGGLVPTDGVLGVLITVVLLCSARGLMVIWGLGRLNRGMFIFVRVRPGLELRDCSFGSLHGGVSYGGLWFGCFGRLFTVFDKRW